MKINQRESGLKEEQKGKERIPGMLGGRHLLQLMCPKGGSL